MEFESFWHQASILNLEIFILGWILINSVNDLVNSRWNDEIEHKVEKNSFEILKN